MSSTSNPIIKGAETDSHSRPHFEIFGQEDSPNFEEKGKNKEKKNKNEFDIMNNKNDEENGIELQIRFRDLTVDNGRSGTKSNEVS